MNAANIVCMTLLGVIAGAGGVFAFTGSLEIAFGLVVAFLIVTIVAVAKESRS